MKQDPVALAEQEVVRRKIAAAADLRRVAANSKRILSSPSVIVGACVGAVVLGYLATGRSRNQDHGRKNGWSPVLATAQLLVPLIRIMSTARRFKAVPRRRSIAAGEVESRPVLVRDR